MAERTVEKVVVFGRDAALWLAANTLAAALGPSGLTVEVVELPSLLRPQDLYPTLPALEPFHRLLDLDEHRLLRATGGSFSLGQSFANFDGGGQPFFHAYGSHGAGLNGVPFLQYWVRARQRGLNVAFEDFSLTAAAAKQGRLALPDEANEGFARTDYGYHLPAQAYAGVLKAQAVRRGVPIHTAFFGSPERDPETGEITALNIGQDRRIAGDLFVDASGAEATLIRGALGEGFVSWRDAFPADRVLAASGPRLRTLPPYAQVRALDRGWLGLYACADATRLISAFDSAQQSDDEALQAAAVVSGLKLGDAVVAALDPGRTANAWSRNCVALGEAACAFDPIDSPGLQAVQTGLVHLLALFPHTVSAEPERREYNRLMAAAYARIRDFQQVHYAFNRRLGSPFWDRPRAAPQSDALKVKVDGFRARGVAPLFDDEAFPGDSWNAVFLGHGLMPETYEPLVDLLDDAALIASLQQMLGRIRTQVEAMSSHDAYLEIFASQEAS